jgi:acetylornithine deacetylase
VIAVDALLAELVAIPSVSGDEGAIADHVMDLVGSWGVDVERLGNTVVAVLEGQGPRFLLCSHLDTVPVGNGWTHDPHAARWDGERLVGRGANDAKASVAAMLVTLQRLASGPRLAGTLQVVLTEGEETRNLGMTRALEHLGMPDGAVIGEPTGLEVVRAQSGLAVLKATWRGRSCHAAHVARVEHQSALHLAAHDLAAGPSWSELEGTHGLLGNSTVAATVLHAGERHNVVPDLAEALFDARLTPRHRAEDVAGFLQGRLPHATVEVQSARLKPFETAADHPLVRAALRVTGNEIALGSSTLSDMALLTGVPAVKCGPGRTERSHTPDEFVLRPEVQAGADAYTRLVPQALEALSTAEVAR